MDDFMQWAMNSLDQQQPAAAAPPSYGGRGGDSGGAGPEAFPFPSLQALRCQSTAAAGGRDLTVQVDHHRASSWSASSCDSPGAAVMDHDATAAGAAGWSPHTTRARTSRPVSWNFSVAASAQTTDASLASPAAPTAASDRGGPSTPAAGRRAGWLLAAPTASHGQGGGAGGGTAASSSASAGGPVQDHIIAERRRREKINERFIELSTVIPGLKKMDKATILGDAAKYVRELQEKVKTLEDGDGGAAATTTIRSAVLVNKKKPCLGFHASSSGDTSTDSADGGGLPEIEVRVSDEKSVLVRIHCENTRGVLVSVLAEVESLRLAITHTSVMPFPAATAIITITAKVEEGFSSTVEEIVRRLNSALNQHYNANSDQNTEKREF